MLQRISCLHLVLHTLTPSPPIRTAQLVIYSVAVGQPSFGVAGPAAIGLALSACALTSGPYTGAALNPARVLGPAVVMGCGAGTWSTVGAYVAAELLGAVAAAVASWPLYGACCCFI